MYESRTSLVYTFRVEEIFEFLSKSVHPRNVHGSNRLHEDKYIPRYVHGTSLGCRVPVGDNTYFPTLCFNLGAFSGRSYNIWNEKLKVY